MNANRYVGALAIAALGVGVSACGSSSKSSTSSPATLTRAALVAKVNSICASAQSQTKAVPSPPSLADPVAAAAYFDKLGPIAAEETQQLAGLTPASDVQADYVRFTTEQQAANRVLQTIRRKADTKDPSGLADLKTKLPRTGQRVSSAANTLGATNCA